MGQRQAEGLADDLCRRGGAEELAAAAGGGAGLAAQFGGLLESNEAVREACADRLDLARVLAVFWWPCDATGHEDAGQVVHMADIYPGAHVVEAGVGSGALTMSLLRAVGDHGRVSSYQRRQDFSDIAREKVERLYLFMLREAKRSR